MSTPGTKFFEIKVDTVRGPCYYICVPKERGGELENLNERIAQTRKTNGLTQEAFGARIGGLSRNYVWMLEKGERVPSNRTIADICREFDVSEEWLRNGTGPMFAERTRDEELAEFFGHVLARDDFKQRLLAALSRLDESEWAMLEQVALKQLYELNG